MIRYQHFTLNIHKPLLFTTYPGFYIRNALVKALTVHCREPGRIHEHLVSGCQGCGRAKVCLYRKLNLPVEKPEGVPGPMPFSLDVSGLHTGKYQSGMLQFGLSLYGRAQHYLPLFEQALESVGRNFGLGEEGQPGQFSISETHKGETLELSELFARKLPDVGEITLHFSHLKLPQQHLDASIHLPFGYLMQLIQSRIMSLTEAFGVDAAKNLQFELLPENTGAMLAEERFALCNYQYTGTGKGHWFLSGDVKFTGDIAPWAGWLEAGSRLGVGRFTSYGFGRFTF